jgi:2'-5' RNA ligase
MDGLRDDLPDLSKFAVKPKHSEGDESVARVVDDELSKIGWSEPARLSFLGDVGRENGWNRGVIFGGHPDPKNKETNRGIISWQGDRRKNLDNYLQSEGVLGKNDDDELRGMVRFADKEMRENKEWQPINAALRNPNISTYDASENLRKYIKYVPEAPYNTPDEDFRVKNNAQWAKRAQSLGLGKLPDLSQYKTDSLPDLTKFAVNPNSQPATTPEQRAAAEAYNNLDLPQGLTRPPTSPTNPVNTIPQALPPDTLPISDVQPLTLTDKDGKTLSEVGAGKGLSEGEKRVVDESGRIFIAKKVTSADGKESYSTMPQGVEVEQLPADYLEYIKARELPDSNELRNEYSQVLKDEQDAYNNSPVKNIVAPTSNVGQAKTPVNTAQNGQNQQASPPPAVLPNAAQTYGTGTADNLAKEPVAVYDVDLSKKPDGISATDYANREALKRHGQFTDAEIDDYLKAVPQTTGYDKLTADELKQETSVPVTLRQGTIDEIKKRRNIDYAAMKEIPNSEPTAEDIDAALRNEAYDNIANSPLSGGTDAEIEAEYQRLKNARLSDETTNTLKGIGGSLQSSLNYGGEVGGRLTGGAIGGLGRLADNISGIAKIPGVSAIDDYIASPLLSLIGFNAPTFAERADLLRQVGTGARIISTESAKNTPVIGKGITVGDLINTAGGAIVDVPKLIGLSYLPGGAYLALAVDAGTQAAGRGERPETIGKEVAKGLVFGALFGGASKLSQLAEKGTLNALAGKSNLAAMRTGAVSNIGEKSFNAAELVSKVIGQGTRIGTVSGGTFAVEKITGSDNDEAFRSAIMNTLFDVAMSAGKAGEITALAGKVFRMNKNGKAADVTVTPTGEVKMLDGEVKPEFVDAEFDLSKVKDVEIDADGVYRASSDNTNIRQRETPTEATAQKRLGETIPPRELSEQNPLRSNAPNPEAVQKVAVDSRAQKVVEQIKDGKTVSVDQLQKLTRINKKNLEEVVMNLYGAKMVEILPDNSIKFIGNEAVTKPVGLYERIKQNEANPEIQPQQTSVSPNNVLPNAENLSPEKASVGEPNDGRLSNAENAKDNLQAQTNQIYEALPQQKAQAEQIAKPVAQVDFAERPNIAEELNNISTAEGGLVRVEPHNLTLEQYVNDIAKAAPNLAKIPEFREQAGKFHRSEVKQAIKDGKEIPVDVIREYPDLANEAKMLWVFSDKERAASAKGDNFIEKDGKLYTPSTQNLDLRETSQREIDSLEQSTKSAHRFAVEQALKDGKPVPAEVLADYPELAQKYGANKPPREFSSTQVNVPKDVSEKIQSFAKKLIPEQDLTDDGYEDKPHITAKFGLHADTVPPEVEAIVKKTTPFDVTLGKVSIFKNNPDFDVVKIDVDSPELHALNKKLAELPNGDEHPTYKPHLTLAYVKKGAGQKYVGNTDFEGQKIPFDALVFSAKDRSKTALKFEGATERQPVKQSDKEDFTTTLRHLLSKPNTPRAANMLGEEKEIKSTPDAVLYQSRRSWDKGTEFPLTVKQYKSANGSRYLAMDGEFIASAAFVDKNNELVGIITDDGMQNVGIGTNLYKFIQAENPQVKAGGIASVQGQKLLDRVAQTAKTSATERQPIAKKDVGIHGFLWNSLINEASATDTTAKQSAFLNAPSVRAAAKADRSASGEQVAEAIKQQIYDANPNLYRDANTAATRTDLSSKDILKWADVNNIPSRDRVKIATAERAAQSRLIDKMLGNPSEYDAETVEQTFERYARNRPSVERYATLKKQKSYENAAKVLSAHGDLEAFKRYLVVKGIDENYAQKIIEKAVEVEEALHAGRDAQNPASGGNESGQGAQTAQSDAAGRLPGKSELEKPHFAAAKGEINLEILYNKDGDFDYEQVKNVAGRIGSGELEITRLAPREEQGRLAGGRRNVEASLIAGAETRAGQAASQGGGPNRKERIAHNTRVEARLEKYAKHENIWFDYDEFTNKYPFFAKGEEARVFEDENKEFVLKTVDYSYFDPKYSLLEFLDERVSLFNFLFPETKYELVGFTRPGDGRFRFILRQPFIVKHKTPTSRQVSELMKGKLGADSELTGEQFANREHHVSDLHKKNVIQDKDGNVFVIDAITELTPDRLGGTREYQQFTVRTPEAKADTNSILQSRADRALTAAVQSVRDKKLSDADLLNKAIVKNIGDGTATLNPEATEFTRRMIEKSFDYNTPAPAFYGAQMSAEQAGVVADYVFETYVKDKSLPMRDRMKARNLMNDILKSADNKHGDVILLTATAAHPQGTELARQEEKGHRALSRSGATKALNANLADKLSAAPILESVEEKYSDLSLAGKLNEGVAKSTRDDAETELNASAETVDKFITDFLDEAESAGVDMDLLAAEFEQVSKKGKQYAEQIRGRDIQRRGRDGANDTDRTLQTGDSRTDSQKTRGGGNNTRPTEVDDRADRFTKLRQGNILERNRSGNEGLVKAARDEINFARTTPTNPTKIVRALTVGKNIALDAVSVPKSLKASVDISAAGRQGLILTVNHPKLAVKAFARQFPSMLSEAKFNQFKRNLDIHPFIDIAEDAGLYLSTLANQGNLGSRDEAYMSRLFADEPLFTNSPKLEKGRRILLSPVMGSERAYVTYLDSIRMDTFATQAKMINEYNVRKGNTVQSLGKDAYNDLVGDQMKGLADFINNATGRGGLGKLEDAAPYFNAGFFSIRYLSSRLQLLNPAYYAQLPAPVRSMAIKHMVTYFGALAAALLLLKMAGGDIGYDDPDNPDMFKVSFGDFHYDLGAGFVQPVRYLARMVQTTLNPKTRGTKEIDLTKKFIRSKLAPTPGAAINLYTGKDFVGQPTGIGKEALGLATPMLFEELPKAYQSEDVKGLAKLIPSVFGIGVSIYKPKSGKSPAPSPEQKSAQLEKLRALQKRTTNETVKANIEKKIAELEK